MQAQFFLQLCCPPKNVSMEKSENVLAGYGDQEKGAYLGAIASIATADRSATEEEVQHLRSLAQAAELSSEQEAAVITAAREPSAEELKDCLDVLKNSDLKFSLVADIITFAKVDQKYTKEEKDNIEKIAEYLQVNQNQFSLLDQFVTKTAEAQPNPEEVRRPGFFESLGLKDRLEKSGINVSSLSKGLISMVGPMILGKMLSGGMKKKTGTNQPFGQSRMPLPSGGGGMGGLGSIFSMLNKGGSYKGLGSVLPKLFK
jgi:uncharacterized tellurite resistance protein B-like protein